MKQVPTVEEFFKELSKKGTTKKFKVLLKNGEICKVIRVYPVSDDCPRYNIRLQDKHGPWSSTGKYFFDLPEYDGCDIVTVYGWFGRVLARSL